MLGGMCIPRGKGYKEYKYEFILINSKHKLTTNETYVLSSQVQQVYYTKDTKALIC